MYKLIDYPAVSYDPTDIDRLRGKSPLGLDLEWDGSGKPTLLGLSDGTLHISVKYSEGRERFLSLLRDYPSTVLVGHNLIGADLLVLAEEGIHLPLSQIEDTIIRHWLVNPHLSKSTNKAALEEDEGEKRGRGFNNLGTMASMYTDFAHWKTCKDGAVVKPGKSIPAPKICSGPCPIHNEPWYNGLDAAAPVIALPKLKRTMLLRGVESLYPMHKKLAHGLSRMQEWGVRIDIPYVERLREEFERDKSTLAQELPFNPDSPPQVKHYFLTKHELSLADAQEQTIRDMVEELGEDAPDELITLQDYKELGNGPDRWFKPVYKDKKGYWKGFMDAKGYVHPHIGYYTSSARMMCSSPNLQNVAKRRMSKKVCECGHKKEEHGAEGKGCRVVGCTGKSGHVFRGESIGKKIRRAIIAPEGMYIVRADYSNAEGRTVLYLAGYEAPKVDMHSWMRDNIGLKEDEPFSLALGGAREAAKSVTHACVTGDHEYLTPNGWKYISEYTPGDQIAQWSMDGSIEFVTPSKFHRYEFNGTLTALKGTALSAITTAEHGWPVLITGTDQGKVYEKWHRVETQNLNKNRIPVVGILKEFEVEGYADLLVQQAVAIQADGSKKQRGGVAFHLVKSRKQTRLEQLFKVSGKPCSCHPGRGKRYYVPKFMVASNPFLTPERQFSKTLLTLPLRQREVFLNEVVLWDGNQSHDARNVNVYLNKNYESVKWVQTIAHLSGREGLYRHWSDATGYTIRFNRRKYADVSRLQKHSLSYCGFVYCFSVPSGFFVIKHNNTISITGNSNYLEGLQLKSESDLKHNPRLRKEIDAGARLVYWNWKFKGKVVTLTGVNLSRRAFGEASLENRAKANGVVSRYIDQAFPNIRTWQKSVTDQVEKEGVVRTRHGYTLISYGISAEDQIKTAVATWGQQATAHMSKLALVDLIDKMDRGLQMRPVLQVHDEILTYVPESISPAESLPMLKASMESETPEMKGFVIPTEASYGPNWRDQTKEGKG